MVPKIYRLAPGSQRDHRPNPCAHPVTAAIVRVRHETGSRSKIRRRRRWATRRTYHRQVGSFLDSQIRRWPLIFNPWPNTLSYRRA